MSKKLLLSLALLAFIAFLSVLSQRNRLTYLEYSDVNQSADTIITVDSSDDVLVQDFVMPYDIMQGLSVQIGTFDRDNNSEWDVAVADASTHKIVYSKHFNSSRLVNNVYYYIAFDKNIRLVKNAKYQIRISASKVNADTSLAFYVSKGAKDNLSLTVAGKKYEGTLCIKIYGGDADLWWTGFSLILCIILFHLMFRILYLSEIRKIKWKNDVVVQSYIVAIISFLLLCTFCSIAPFMDETDNMLGGWVIAHGGVLYRDYVTQHPPFAYYLSAVFALFGAKSVEQFRLSYYLLISVVWGLLYLRHKEQFGKKMFLLPVVESVVINSMVIGNPGRPDCMILSDGIQAICFIALLLEFFTFCKDSTLNWVRAVIVSACIWGSIGSAFLSAFVLIWIAAAFIVEEFKKWRQEGVSLFRLVSRYWKLLTAVAIPLMMALAYFRINDSLQKAVEQSYSFNREIYTNYGIGTIGQSVISPFVFSFRNFFDIITDHFNSLMNAHASTSIVLQLIILITAAAILVGMLMKRKFLKPALLFCVLCFAGARGNNDFHFLAAWCIAIMIIVLFYDELFESLHKVSIALLVIVGVYSSSIYVHSVGDNLLYKQKSVTEFEHYMISVTVPYEKMIFDATSCKPWSEMCNSLYLLYKKRDIVNRLQYILPWYMDWYEQDTIDDLEKNKPNYVFFCNGWGSEPYASSLMKKLNQNYQKNSDKQDGAWGSCVWKRNI